MPGVGKSASEWLGVAYVPELRWQTNRLSAVEGNELGWLYGQGVERLARALAVERAKAAEIKRQLDAFNVTAETRRLDAAGIEVVTWADEAYPVELRDIPYPPAAVFYKGEPLQDSASPRVAIVGSRKCTAYGRHVARELGADLAAAGVTVVSGMALGIDTAAHEGSLSGGDTIAVLGSGVDVIYPRQNDALAERIRQRGTLASELPPGTPPLAMHFPARNRIISGLSQAVVIVEASEKSGALITADFALAQGREVMVVPGSVKSATSAGCHSLLRAGAALVGCAADILELLDLWGGRPLAARPRLSAEEATLVELMEYESVTVDQLLPRTNVGAGALLALLAGLELKGIVRQEAGGRYRVVC